MTKVANQNLELEAKLGNAVKTVKKNYSSSVKGKFAIGEVLYETKPSDNSSDEEKKAYSDIFSELHLEKPLEISSFVSTTQITFVNSLRVLRW